MTGTLAVISRYGNLELKRAYQRNMIIGILIASLILVSAVGAWATFGSSEPDQEDGISGVIKVRSDTLDIGPPPIIDEEVERYRPVRPLEDDISFGPPKAVDDDEIVDEAEIATIDDIKDFIEVKRVTEINEIDIDKIEIVEPDSMLPSSDVFIPYEEAPALIDRVMPIYPEVARKAGIEGWVWVNVFIGIDGTVKDVQVLKDSGANAGFIEASVEAAMQSIWKPAISNSQPVGVWMSYEVKFILD